MEKPLIGFVGQGWIGKNYANDFETRGFETVRYALEEPYVHNKNRVQTCDIVLIAVPTPTTPKGFDASIVESALKLVGNGNIAVIKSTITPGTTSRFQKKYKNITIIYSPEFLSEATAAHDAAHPFSNILGLAADTVTHHTAAEKVFSFLPSAPFKLVCTSTEAELIKYSHNVSAYTQILTFNALYDLSQKLGCKWEAVHAALVKDPYICNRYSQPVHKSGRGAGGGCFIKDFAAFSDVYRTTLKNSKEAILFLKAAEKYNITLLQSTKKDLGLLAGVYGRKAVAKKRKRK